MPYYNPTYVPNNNIKLKIRILKDIPKSTY